MICMFRLGWEVDSDSALPGFLFLLCVCSSLLSDWLGSRGREDNIRDVSHSCFCDCCFSVLVSSCSLDVLSLEESSTNLRSCQIKSVKLKGMQSCSWRCDYLKTDEKHILISWITFITLSSFPYVVELCVGVAMETFPCEMTDHFNVCMKLFLNPKCNSERVREPSPLGRDIILKKKLAEFIQI